MKHNNQESNGSKGSQNSSKIKIELNNKIKALISSKTVSNIFHFQNQFKRKYKTNQIISKEKINDLNTKPALMINKLMTSSSLVKIASEKRFILPKKIRDKVKKLYQRNENNNLITNNKNITSNTIYNKDGNISDFFFISPEMIFESGMKINPKKALIPGLGKPIFSNGSNGSVLAYAVLTHP